MARQKNAENSIEDACEYMACFKVNDIKINAFLESETQSCNYRDTESRKTVITLTCCNE